MLNQDYKDMLLALSGERARYVLVGAYAMAIHGYLRATSDIDIWVMPTSENARAVIRALEIFGAPLQNLTQADLVKDDTVFQIGVAPHRIDILTGAMGLKFDEAAARAVKADLDGIQVLVLSLDDLIRNKRASGRTRDLADAEALESLRDPQKPVVPSPCEE